jgi:hypothetical protein
LILDVPHSIRSEEFFQGPDPGPRDRQHESAQWVIYECLRNDFCDLLQIRHSKHPAAVVIDETISLLPANDFQSSLDLPN